MGIYLVTPVWKENLKSNNSNYRFSSTFTIYILGILNCIQKTSCSTSLPETLFSSSTFWLIPAFVQTQSNWYQAAADTKCGFFSRLQLPPQLPHLDILSLSGLINFLLSLYFLLIFSFPFFLGTPLQYPVFLLGTMIPSVFQSTVCHKQHNHSRREQAFNFRASKLHVAGSRTDNKTRFIV